MVSAEQVRTCAVIAKRFGATKLVLFGSAVADPANARDIDLVSFGVSGWDFMRMGAAMEAACNVQVDVLPYEPGSRFLSYVLPQGRVVYET